MKKNSYVFEELIDRKKYLLSENYCPNVGEFKYGKSKNVDSILHGSDVYRYDIYNYRDDDYRIKNLGGGDPISFKTYKYVKKNITNFLKNDNLHTYPHTAGDGETKEKLIEYLDSIGVKNISEDEILVTASTTHAYTLLLNSIVREHDVVIIPIPTYGLFTYIPEKLGATVEFVELNEKDGWKIDLKILEKKIIKINELLKEKYNDLPYVPRVVALYNQNPNNPLGTSIGNVDIDYLHDLAQLCDKYGVLIIDDLIYRDSVYDEAKIAIPISSFKEFKNNVISLLGISKSFSLAGIRSGFVVGNKYIIQDMRDILFLQMDSVSKLSQIALASVFNNEKGNVKYRNKYLNRVKKKYMTNMETVKFFVDGSEGISKKTLNKIKRNLSKKEFCYYKSGIKDVSIYNNLIPESGFFILLDFTKIKGKKISDKTIENDTDLIIELYKKDKIKFLPGSSFGWINKSQIIGRVTFSQYWNILFDNMKSLAKIMKEIR